MVTSKQMCFQIWSDRTAKLSRVSSTNKLCRTRNIHSKTVKTEPMATNRQPSVSQWWTVELL